MSGCISNAVRATTTTVPFHVEAGRELYAATQGALVQVALPEYLCNGLDSALIDAVRYELEDGRCALAGLPLGPSSARIRVIYDDMAPVVMGFSHAEIHQQAPEVAAELAKDFPPELVSVGVMRHLQGGTADLKTDLKTYVRVYSARASWLEEHFLMAALSASHNRSIDWHVSLPDEPELEGVPHG